MRTRPSLLSRGLPHFSNRLSTLGLTPHGVGYLDRTMLSSLFTKVVHLRAGLFIGALMLLCGCTTIPELGMVTDSGITHRSIVVRLNEQKAFLYHYGRLVAVSEVSTGREGYATPAGKYRVVQKDIDHRSTVYGAYVKDGRVVKANVNVTKDKKPPGAVFVGAPMPYFLRISGAIGLHAGHVPGYPASHGCIRLPPREARRFYYAVQVGTPVTIYR